MEQPQMTKHLKIKYERYFAPDCSLTFVVVVSIHPSQKTMEFWNDNPDFAMSPY